MDHDNILLASMSAFLAAFEPFVVCWRHLVFINTPCLSRFCPSHLLFLILKCALIVIHVVKSFMEVGVFFIYHVYTFVCIHVLFSSHFVFLSFCTLRFFFYLSLFLSFFFTTCALLIGVFKLVCISIWEGVLAQSFVHVPILLCTRDTCMTFITCTCHVMCSFPLRQLTQISRSKDQTAEDNRNNYILQLEATNEFRNTHYTQRMPNLMDVSDTPPRYVYNVVRFF